MLTKFENNNADRWGEALNNFFAYLSSVTVNTKPCGMCSYKQSCGFSGTKNCAAPPWDMGRSGGSKQCVDVICGIVQPTRHTGRARSFHSTWLNRSAATPISARTISRRRATASTRSSSRTIRAFHTKNNVQNPQLTCLQEGSLPTVAIGHSQANWRRCCL